MSFVEKKPEPRLALLEGGKGNNWLSRLPLGTVFLTRKAIPEEFGLLYLQLVGKTKHAARVMDVDPPHGGRWVDPIKFSIGMDLFEIVVLGSDEDADGDDDDRE